MKNNSDFRYRGARPDCILEIRLSQEMWRRVAVAAQKKGSTYSWVVRYCLFRLIRPMHPMRPGRPGFAASPLGGLGGESRFARLWEDAARQKHAPRLHRHRLCLYGVDELYVRTCAAMLGCTMTHLVRLALEAQLSRLEAENPQASFYWLGIKRHLDVDFPIGTTAHTAIFLRRFPLAAYY